MLTIWHNPRCSKSRQTLEILQQHNADPEVIEYLKTPPSAERIDALLKALDMTPRQLMRTGEAIYAELSLDNEALTHDQLIAAMADNPKLIERPIVVVNDQDSQTEKVAIGRPPESVLAIL